MVVHDPQPAGLIPAIREIGCAAVWRCHVGQDQPDPLARRAWDFLIPASATQDAYVFSREAFEWEGLDKEDVTVIPPSIDAFAPKNQELDRERVLSSTAAGLKTPRRCGHPADLHAFGWQPGPRGPPRAALGAPPAALV